MEAMILEHKCSVTGRNCKLYGVLSQIPALVFDGIAHADVISDSIELKLYRSTGIENDDADISLAVQVLRISPRAFSKFVEDVNTIHRTFIDQEPLIAEVNEVVMSEIEDPDEVVGIRLA